MILIAGATRPHVHLASVLVPLACIKASSMLTLDLPRWLARRLLRRLLRRRCLCRRLCRCLRRWSLSRGLGWSFRSRGLRRLRGWWSHEQLEGLEGGTETGEEALDRLWDFVVILGVLALEGLKRLVEGDELCLEGGVHLDELFLSLSELTVGRLLYCIRSYGANFRPFALLQFRLKRRH